ncbi:transcriptional regulator with XRE-family HTH domain [Parabacteroides sp. PF5-6]|nr:transcriptional regulator with XRE-family HTH domain [Parabacteroides sp. PF5-6]
MQYIAYMDIFETLKQRRLLLDITQQDLADFSGIGLRTIRQLEAGKGNPSVETLSRLLDVLGMEIDIRVKKPKNV